jgi:hypothetical protein
MSAASSYRATAKTASSRTSEQTYDLAILVSVGIVALGVVVAIYALAIHPGVSPNELGFMVAYP